jgi:hypothetical protein
MSNIHIPTPSNSSCRLIQYSTGRLGGDSTSLKRRSVSAVEALRRFRLFAASMSRTYTLWCLIDGDKTPFNVIIPIYSYIDDLKDSLECSSMLENLDASNLIPWKVCYFW